MEKSAKYASLEDNDEDPHIASSPDSLDRAMIPSPDPNDLVAPVVSFHNNNNKVETMQIEQMDDRRNRECLCSKRTAIILIITLIVTFALILMVASQDNKQNTNHSHGHRNQYVMGCDPRFNNYLLIVSFDGFRASYLNKDYRQKHNLSLPNFDFIIQNGIEKFNYKNVQKKNQKTKKPAHKTRLK